MTREEKQKAIDALKISAPVIAMTQEEFNDYIQTINKIMDWLEQESKTEKVIKIRDATPEERESIAKYIKSISKPTGVSFETPEQEPCEIEAVKPQQAYSKGFEDCRQAVLASIKNLYPDMPIVDIFGARRKWLEKYAPYFECENAVEQLPPVTPHPKIIKESDT